MKRSVRFVFNPNLHENTQISVQEAVAQQDFESLSKTIFLPRNRRRDDRECEIYEGECVKYALSLCVQKNIIDQSFIHKILCYDVDFSSLPKNLPFNDTDIEEFKSAFAGVEKRVEFLVSEFSEIGNTGMLTLFMNYPQEVTLNSDPGISKEIAKEILIGLPSDFLTQRLKSVSGNKNYNFGIESNITHSIQEGDYEKTKQLIMEIDPNIDEDQKKSFIEKRFEYALKESLKYKKTEMIEKFSLDYFEHKQPASVNQPRSSARFSPAPPEIPRTYS